MKRRIVESTGFNQDQIGGIQRAFDGLDAYSIAYTPADTSDWASPPPTTVGEALDRLAAAASSPP